MLAGTPIYNTLIPYQSFILYGLRNYFSNLVNISLVPHSIKADKCPVGNFVQVAQNCILATNKTCSLKDV
ncbi:MAG: hypothetical protein HUJ51_05090 [Eggerthellaceae bacterium]|nr:hypothetical protein [Eggerthellaceae bacterium]